MNAIFKAFPNFNVNLSAYDRKRCRDNAKAIINAGGRVVVRIPDNTEKAFSGADMEEEVFQYLAIHLDAEAFFGGERLKTFRLREAVPLPSTKPASVGVFERIVSDVHELEPAEIVEDQASEESAAADATVTAEPSGEGGSPAIKMKKPRKPPSQVRTYTSTLNEFIGPTGHLSWPDIKKTQDGEFVPKPTCANACVAILALQIDCRHDLFHDKLLVGGQPIEQWAGELSDHACQIMRVLIRRHFGFDPGRENIHDAAIQLCLQNPFDPVLDYLDSLEWDGKARLDSWLIDYLNAEDTELNRSFGRLALIAAVRRARQPGCKFDQIIVLEGGEGKNKSSAIEAMASEAYFSDQPILGVDDKRQMELLKGKWLYEIADLTGMRRSEVESVKAFASRRIDRGRPAYGKHVVDQPRRCVIFATTNDDAYLKSQTGNRRFWPVKTGRVALDSLRRDRDQLWAEAAHAEAEGESIVLPERLWPLAAIEQQKRLEHDPWDDVLQDVEGEVHSKSDHDEERVASVTLINEVLKIPIDRQSKEVEKKIGQCMRRLGWDGPKSQRLKSFPKPMRGYCRRIPARMAERADASGVTRPPWRRGS